MKFKIGDRVKIIKECNCEFREDCRFLKDFKVEGIIIAEQTNFDKGDWIVRINGKDKCHFFENQLELVRKNVKQYGIVKFLETICK